MLNEMKKENLIVGKSFAFALRIIETYKYLCANRKEYVLSKQLLRSGTSIGANVNEAQAAQSKNDFLSKMAIASKEARETKYWLNLLKESNYLTTEENDINRLLSECEDVVNVLTKIIKTGSEQRKF